MDWELNYDGRTVIGKTKNNLYSDHFQFSGNYERLKTEAPELVAIADQMEKSMEAVGSIIDRLGWSGADIGRRPRCDKFRKIVQEDSEKG